MHKEADIPFKGVFNVRVNPELYPKLAEMALKEEITLNAFISKMPGKEINHHHTEA